MRNSVFRVVLGLSSLKGFRGAHAFASNTLDYLSDAIDLGPGL